MPESVLFVDDEENVLNAVERLFKFSDFNTLRANSAQDALDILKRETVAVIVSDNQMPGLKGIDLFERTKQLVPDTVRILMTGFADLPTAVAAINRGEVFRFVTKPWNNDELEETVRVALGRYSIVRSLRQADEPALRSIAQTIELKDPYTRGHCDRVAEYALMIADGLGMSDETNKEIKHGSWLHDCGKIGVPEAILNAARALTDDEFSVMKQHPVWGADVARLAKLSDSIVNIILYHHEHWDGNGYPFGVTGTSIPIEARIVALADVFDAMTTDRPYCKGMTLKDAAAKVYSLRGTYLDPKLVDVFIGQLMTTRKIQLNDRV